MNFDFSHFYLFQIIFTRNDDETMKKLNFQNWKIYFHYLAKRSKFEKKENFFRCAVRYRQWFFTLWRDTSIYTMHVRAFVDIYWILNKSELLTAQTFCFYSFFVAILNIRIQRKYLFSIGVSCWLMSRTRKNSYEWTVLFRFKMFKNSNNWKN